MIYVPREVNCCFVVYRKLFEGPQTVLGHGPITLLVSKAANLLNRTLPDTDQFGVLPSQRALVEITELINGAHLIHSEVVDLSRTDTGQWNEAERTCDLGDLTFGNKMVILGGDMLLARACKELAQLHKPRVSKTV